jgi:hypothetical protein
VLRLSGEAEGLEYLPEGSLGEVDVVLSRDKGLAPVILDGGSRASTISNLKRDELLKDKSPRLFAGTFRSHLPPRLQAMRLQIASAIRAALATRLPFSASFFILAHSIPSQDRNHCRISQS